MTSTTMLTLKLILVACLLNACTKTPEVNRIHYPNTIEYSDIVSRMPINESQARSLLRAATKNGPPVYFDRSAIFFVNEEYCFGIPRKTSLPLTGYYVNARTGSIVYRQSSKNLTSRDSRLPPHAYESETPINPGP
jgi:hypothetical protein